MNVTFPVDDVARATGSMPTRRLADVVGDVLALGGEAERRVVDHGRTHPLLGAVHLAFAQHRPLVLSPDAVWITIAQGVAHHVRLHADELRPRLVRHAERKRLEIEWPTETAPTDAAAWATIVAAFSECIADEVGPGPVRLFECDFSTTTVVERVASQIVLMDAYSPYFDYYLACVCGIPEITLRGTVADWRTIRDRIDVIAQLDLSFWARSLRPICDQFVRAADGDVDVAFWQRIFPWMSPALGQRRRHAGRRGVAVGEPRRRCVARGAHREPAAARRHDVLGPLRLLDPACRSGAVPRPR